MAAADLQRDFVTKHDAAFTRQKTIEVGLVHYLGLFSV